MKLYAKIVLGLWVDHHRIVFARDAINPLDEAKPSKLSTVTGIPIVSRAMFAKSRFKMACSIKETAFPTAKTTQSSFFVAAAVVVVVVNNDVHTFIYFEGYKY